MENLTAYVDWAKICEKECLTEAFIKKYESRIDFELLSRNKKQVFTLSLVKEYLDKWDWYYLSVRHLSDDIIDECFSKLDKYRYFLDNKQPINEELLRKNIHLIKPYEFKPLVIRRKLSISFLEDYFDHFPKKDVSRYQKLTKKFIDAHRDELDYEEMLRNPKINHNWIVPEKDRLMVFENNLLNPEKTLLRMLDKLNCTREELAKKDITFSFSNVKKKSCQVDIHLVEKQYIDNFHHTTFLHLENEGAAQRYFNVLLLTLEEKGIK